MEKQRKEFNFNLGDSKEKPSVSDDEHKKAVEHLDKIMGSSSSSEEQSRRYEEVLNDPPEKGFNEVEVYKAMDSDDNLCGAIKDPEGDAIAKIDGEDVKVTLIEPLIKFDLFELFEGQLSEASIDVVPHLMDEKVQIEMNERKEYKPEKAKKDLSNYYWVLYLVMFLPMIIIGLLWLGGIW